MPDDITLQLDQRTVTGKKVRYLRRDGIIPGNVYGRGLASVAVQAPCGSCGASSAVTTATRW